MDPERESAVRLLNGLIETALDSAQGYEAAAENAREGRLKTLFAERSRRRRELARQLQQEVRTFGGEPKAGPSRLGQVHDRFVDLAAAIVEGHDEQAVIDGLERGEDVIKAKFEKAMAAENLPAASRPVVSHACECIRADHDEIRRMKHRPH